MSIKQGEKKKPAAKIKGKQRMFFKIIIEISQLIYYYISVNFDDLF